MSYHDELVSSSAPVLMLNHGTPGALSYRFIDGSTSQPIAAVLGPIGYETERHETNTVPYETRVARRRFKVYGPPPPITAVVIDTTTNEEWGIERISGSATLATLECERVLASNYGKYELK